MELVGRVKWMLDNNHYDGCFIDKTGLGTGVVDRLHELGYPVVGINFGSGAFDINRYTNKRNEIWGELLEWMRDEPVFIEADKPDEMRTEMCAATYTLDSKTRRVLIEKKKMKKDLEFSPDLADALALTFAQPVPLYEEGLNAGTGHDTGGRDEEVGY